MQLLEERLSPAWRTGRLAPPLRRLAGFLAHFILPGAFLCLVLPLCIVLAVITPPGGGPDEPAHTVRADSLANGQLIATRRITQTPAGPQLTVGFKADPAMLWVSSLMAGGRKKASVDTMAQIQALGWTGPRTYMPLGGAAPYPPLLYVPAALAIKLARLTRASPFEAFIAARFANIIVFAALGLLALLMARRGQAILFCALAVPMTASLAGIITQDGMLIGGAALAMALLTRADAIDPSTQRPGRAWWAAAVLIGVLAMVKPPYACLAAGLLLPLRPCNRVLLHRAGYAALAILPAILWTGFAMWRLSVPLLDFGPYHPGPLWPGAAEASFHAPDAAAQLQVLAVKPWRPFWLTWHTIRQDVWLTRAMTGVLGWLEIVLPAWLYSLWGVAGIAACLAAILSPATPAARAPSWRDHVLMLGAACLGLVAIYMALYLAWTRVGETIVMGVQGRYLLPLVPMLALGLPSLRLKHGDALATLLGLPGVVAAAAGLAAVPLAVIATYYIR